MAGNNLNSSQRATNDGLDPFVDAQGEKSYFVTPALRQRIDLIRHLIEFGRQIIVLTGPPGAGKSALLERVTDTEEKNWQVLRFFAGPTLNQANLLTKIAGELAIDDASGDEGETIEAIRKRVKASNLRGESTILAIDDAHILPADAHACLTRLAHSVDEAAELKIVLSADPAQSPLIDQLQSETSQHSLVHVVEIPRLSDVQTQAMLTHRWQAAYGNDEIPLGAAEMSQIYRQSNGVPGKAIVLARQVQVLNGGRERLSRDPAQRYLIGGVALIVVFIAFAFFNADEPDKEHETQIELELPGEPEMVALPPVTPAQEQILPQQPIVSEPAPPAELSSGSTVPDEPIIDDELPLPSRPGPVMPGTAPSGEADAVADADETPPRAAETETEAEPKPKPAAPRPEPPAAVSKPAAPAASSERYSMAWLRSQRGGGYVLQLFGVRDRGAAAKFIETRKIGDNSAILVTKHKGAPWYVVVYGYYPDRAAATAAIPDLPANLAATKPWARPVASLQ